MKLAIVGTRNNVITFDEFRRMVVSSVKQSEVTEIVSGGAKGIDTYAEKLAEEWGVPCTVFKPEYSRYGRVAPLLRNTQIVERADVVLAFPKPTSTGTFDSIRKAKKLNKKLIIKQL